jgi:hypothetical protein
MDAAFRQAVLTAYGALPDDCRYAPATEEQLQLFEREFGSIPPDYRWFLAACGSGVCGAEWLDGIEQLRVSHRKFRDEFAPGGWTMRGVFIIGWDGAGNPFGIDQSSGQVLVEDHNFGGIHEMAKSFREFLAQGLGLDAK